MIFCGKGTGTFPQLLKGKTLENLKMLSFYVGIDQIDCYVSVSGVFAFILFHRISLQVGKLR